MKDVGETSEEEEIGEAAGEVGKENKVVGENYLHFSIITKHSGKLEQFSLLNELKNKRRI